MRQTLFGWRVTRLMPALVILNACSSSDRATAPRSRPEFAISDAVHEGGTPGFYFLPPMVAQPAFSGTFDGDIATLNPVIAICDLTNDVNCGTSSATLIVFTTTSTPAITVDLTTPQYQVNWNTQAAGFLAGHTYRAHATAGASGARRELGFADVLLTTTPGQAKSLQTGDILVLQDGRTLPIHLRIESGISGSLAVSAASASIATSGTDVITATLHDLHGAPLVGAMLVWSVSTIPPTGVADVTQPLSPTSGVTASDGTLATTFKAGMTSGTAIVSATSAGLSGTATITTTAVGQTITLISGNGVVGGRDPANQFTLDGVSWEDAFIINTVSLPYSVIPGTLWLSQVSDANGPANTATRFRTTFTLPQAYSGASLSVDVFADNVATIFLNGVQVGQQPFAEIFPNFQNPPSNFTAVDPTLFRSGTNTLEFTIYNFSGPSGFDYKALVTFSQ